MGSTPKCPHVIAYHTLLRPTHARLPHHPKVSLSLAQVSEEQENSLAGSDFAPGLCVVSGATRQAMGGGMSEVARATNLFADAMAEASKEEVSQFAGPRLLILSRLVPSHLTSSSHLASPSPLIPTGPYLTSSHLTSSHLSTPHLTSQTS